MKRPVKTVLLPSTVVFFAVILLVAISFFMGKNSIKQELATAVNDYTRETENTINERFNTFEITLQAGQGLVSGNPNVTQAQWLSFVQTSAVIERYPESRGINYAKVVPAANADSFTADMRQKTVPDFHIQSTGKSSYTPVIFIAPYDESKRSTFGFDITSDAIRKHAVDTATATGKPTLSDPIKRLQAGPGDPYAFLMYSPQYKLGMPTETVQERQVAIEGYAYAGFNTTALAAGLSQSKKDQNIAFVVHNGDTGTQLYRSPRYDALLKGVHRLEHGSVQIGATKLYITYVYNPNTLLPAYVSQRPVAILIFGTLVAMLIAFTVWVVLASKASELLLEQERGINEAKDNLLSLASHQLRTPATGVKQFLGLVLQGFAGDVSPRQQDILQKAYDSNERQLKTINDILYVARMGSGRIVLTKTSFSVAILVKDIVREVSDDIKDKRHRVAVRVPKRERMFYGDEHMIRMAIENLLSNAIKYTHKKGKITVRVSYQPQLKITVEDTGIGIPADQQEEMFQQFVRIDNELSVAVGGTGIGLYVVKNIANLHNGRIEVTSEQGAGSKFILILPFENKDKTNKV